MIQVFSISPSLEVFAGIGWDPEIRGFLTVALAAAALMGTVWLLLVTNTGVRLGSLVAMAGFFGWFTIMAVIWWLFGIGYTGDLPSWEFVEVIDDPAGEEETGLEEFLELPDPNCSSDRIFPIEKTNWTFSPPASGCTPKAIGLVLAFDGSSRATVIEELATVDTEDIRETIVSRNALRDFDDPRYLTPQEVEEEIARLVDKEEIKLDQVSLSALASTAPQVIDWAVERNYLVLGDWNLLSTSESGEASNAAAAVLAELDLFPETPEAATPAFLVLDSYQKGGKPDPKSGAIWDRVANKITNSVQFSHPSNDVIIQARAVIPKEQELGQAAPLAVIDPESQTLSIHMRRNLGDLRLVPGLLAIGSGLIFSALALTLHVRHRRELEVEGTA